MDAGPLLAQVAAALRKCRLEAVLIGNGAAALQGAPVTTVDLDFMFRSSPVNLRKLKRFADHMEATIMRPYYPASKLFRVVNDDQGVQVDFMGLVHGIRSFERLRSRAQRLRLNGEALWVAALSDIIASKRATNRARDRAVLEILERTQREKEGQEARLAKRKRPAEP